MNDNLINALKKVRKTNKIIKNSMKEVNCVREKSNWNKRNFLYILFMNQSSIYLSLMCIYQYSTYIIFFESFESRLYARIFICITTVELSNSGNLTSNNATAYSIGHIPNIPIPPIISFFFFFFLLSLGLHLQQMEVPRLGT